MKKLLVYTFAFFLALHGGVAMAFTDDGVEAEPLSFGQIIITDNAAPRSCTIPASGTMTCDPEITILTPGQAGVFRLSGYDPSVAIWAWVNDSITTMTGPGGLAFDVRSFTFDPPIDDLGTAQTPGADGTLMLKIGATLKTRTGLSYDVAPYRGTFTLQINY